MATRGILRRLLVLGEKQALQDLIVYTNLAGEATSLLVSQLSSSEAVQGEFSQKIRQIEKRGDDLTMEIKAEITQGAINSTLLGHLLSLVEISDDFLDRSLYISREIGRMSHYLINNQAADEYIKQKIYPMFAEMLKINWDALENLKEMLGGHSVDGMKGNRRAIELCEEKVDDLKDDIIDQVYVDADNLHYVVFTHIVNTVHRIDDLLDDCEDASDLVMTISTSVSR